MSESRGFAAPLILLLIAIILIGAGAYNYFHNKNSPQPTIDTSNWSTYRSAKYDFEIKYPSDWKVEEIQNYDSQSQPTGGTSIYLKSTDLHGIILNPLGDHPVTLSNKKDSLNGWVVHVPNQKYPNFLIEVLTLNARETIDPNKLPLIDGIISTFKFTQATSTTQSSDWKTYRNDKY